MEKNRVIELRDRVKQIANINFFEYTPCNQECSKYGMGKPGIFTSVPKMRKWIEDTLNELNERSNDSNINRPIFFVILSMIGSVFLKINNMKNH